LPAAGRPHGRAPTARATSPDGGELVVDLGEALLGDRGLGRLERLLGGVEGEACVGQGSEGVVHGPRG
jgi:hypothetical protein